MKRFLINCGIVLGAFSVITVSLYLLTAGHNKDSYHRAYDLKCRLLEKTDSPRVLFVGDSNLACGLDSERIQDSLQINVVNAGLAADLGSLYIIDDILLYAREGDIIILAMEDGGVNGKGDGVPTTLSHVLSCHPEKWKLLNRKQWMNVIVGMPKAIKAELKPSKSKDKLASRFNEFGDEVRHWGEDSLYKVSVKKGGDFNLETANYLLRRIRQLDEKCEVHLMPAAVIESYYDLNKERLESVAKWYADNGYPYIVPVQRHVFLDEDRYNSPFHLNKRGVDKYTASVIEALKPIVKRNEGMKE